MPSGANWFHYVVYVLILLAVIPSIARDAAFRFRAGPVRFRLGLASRMGSARNKAAYIAFAFMSVSVLFLIVTDFKQAWPYVPLFLPMIVNGLESDARRRGTKRWLVTVSGLIALASGLVFLAVVPGIIPLKSTFFTELPRAFWCALGLLWAMSGISAIRESIVGTLVRDGGIEMLRATYPWSRIVVKGWEEGDGGPALRLVIRSVANYEVLVPVPASERAALEEFLAGHTTTAATLPAGQDARRFPESPTPEATAPS